jgi:hemerythrin superfamily protein
MKAGLMLVTALLLACFGACKQDKPDSVPVMQGKNPLLKSIQSEHNELLSIIHTMTAYPDSAGIIARKTEELLRHHFEEEENYALIPLSYLHAVNSGNIPENSDDIIRMSEYLVTQQGHLNVEHQLISAYIKELIAAANPAQHTAVKSFADRVKQHASAEEEIYFPAAILVGEHLKKIRGAQPK